jgi:hypothetical protein
MHYVATFSGFVVLLSQMKFLYPIAALEVTIGCRGLISGYYRYPFQVYLLDWHRQLPPL